MLMNNLDPEVAERPEDLVVYGGTGRAARSWEAFDAIVRVAARRSRATRRCWCSRASRSGVFRTHADAPRVLIANANLVPAWATWETFRDLEDRGLTMYGQMTAGSWIYIGTQGILQGTYETLAALAARHFGGSLAGRLTVTRRPRRHGRRPAAGGDHERRRGAGRRGRPGADRPPPGHALRRRGDRFARRRRWRAAPSGHAAGTRAIDRAVRATPPRCCRRWSRAAWCPTWSPIRPRRTTPSAATCPTA